MPGLEVGGLAEVEDSVQWLQRDLAEWCLVEGPRTAVELWEDFESISLPGFVIPVQVDLSQALSSGKLSAGSI